MVWVSEAFLEAVWCFVTCSQCVCGVSCDKTILLCMTTIGIYIYSYINY